MLAGIVYYLTQQPTPQEASAKAKTPQIMTFSANAATKLVIAGGGKTTEIDLKGSNWQLVKPITGPADASRVEDWLGQLGSLTADQVLKSPSTDLSQYGLTKPTLDVTVSLSGGKSAKLTLGAKTMDGNDYYAQVAGDKQIYLVNSPLGDDLKSALDTPPKALPTPTSAPTLIPATPKAGATPLVPAAPTATPAG